MNVAERTSADRWAIGAVEVPGRVVLAPMAGISAQAFRRQGRRFGVGLVCSEMVSACGLHHGNERTHGYLRIARDERRWRCRSSAPSRPLMAEAARMVVDAGADLVDINMGCPVRKVTKTGAGCSLLEPDGGDLAARIVEAVAGAVDVPVTVKMRRGAARRLAHAAWRSAAASSRPARAALTLHPRSAQQMYTGTADHALTAELVSIVDVPVIASGDVTTPRHRAEAVLHATGCAAVMVARAAQGNPGCCASWPAAPGRGADERRDRRRAGALRARGRARDGRAARPCRSCASSTGGTCAAGAFARSLRIRAGGRSRRSTRSRRGCSPPRPARASAGARVVAERSPTGDDAELGLPISVYGGG